jgi:hypothetical protein
MSEPSILRPPHVCISLCGQPQRPLFRSLDDFRHGRQLLQDLHSGTGAITLGYCLLPGSIHWLIREGDMAATAVADGLRQQYTHYYNARGGRHGSIFTELTGLLTLTPQRQLAPLIRHLHQLPIRQRLVPTADCYRWSSHDLYLQATTGPRQDWFDPRPLLLRLANQRQPLRRYQHYMEQPGAELHLLLEDGQPRCGELAGREQQAIPAG